jgi:hypothetical protein
MTEQHLESRIVLQLLKLSAQSESFGLSEQI